MCTRYSNISCMRLVFESADCFVQHVWRHGNNSRVATNREQHLVASSVWSSKCGTIFVMGVGKHNMVVISKIGTYIY